MTFKKLLALFLFSFFLTVNVISQENGGQPVGGTGTVDEQELVIEDAAPAADTGEAEENRQLGTFTFSDFIRMVMILLFVILCIYALFYFLKKAGTQKYDENDIINVIASKSISQNKTIHIVEIGNQIILIGASDNSLNMITEVTDRETIDRIRIYKGETKKPAENSFYSYLVNNFLKAGGKRKKAGNAKEDDFSYEYLKKQRERIEKMGQ